jgi:Cu(I)/Ag(I) efflux system membrane fusion protein
MKTSCLMVFSLLVLLGLGSQSLAGTAKFDKQMQSILNEYLKIPKALAGDTTKGVIGAAEKIRTLAKKLDSSSVTGEHAKHFKDLPEKLKAAADKLAKAKNIASMREALKELSKPMAMWASMSKPKGISVVYCSMAPGSWLQKGTLIANPYYGAKMLRCGEIVGGEGRK